MMNLVKKVVVMSVLIGVLFSCEKDNTIPAGQGAVTVKLTDDPFPFDFVAEANVGISKIELRNTDGEYSTVFEGSTTVNMVGLTNGETETVVTANLEPGTYNQVRVSLDAASVQLSNGTEYEMNADAQGTYSITISPALVIEEGDTSTCLLDLDIDSSFDFQGSWFGQWVSDISNIMGCSFDADFRACDLDQTGEIQGSVTNGGAIVSGAFVTIEVDGNEVSTQTQEDGSFTFIGIPEGTYTVEVETEGSASGELSNVQVTGNGTANCTITVD